MQVVNPVFEVIDSAVSVIDGDNKRINLGIMDIFTDELIIHEQSHLSQIFLGMPRIIPERN